MPHLDCFVAPGSHTFAFKGLIDCNWLQSLEGGIDSSHVSWLHRGDVKADPLFKNAGGNKYNLNDLAPVFEVIESEGGLFIGARRMAEDDQYYWRITPWLMPCFTAALQMRAPSRCVARPRLRASAVASPRPVAANHASPPALPLVDHEIVTPLRRACASHAVRSASAMPAESHCGSVTVTLRSIASSVVPTRRLW